MFNGRITREGWFVIAIGLGLAIGAAADELLLGVTLGCGIGVAIYASQKEGDAD